MVKNIGTVNDILKIEESSKNFKQTKCELRMIKSMKSGMFGKIDTALFMVSKTTDFRSLAQFSLRRPLNFAFFLKINWTKKEVFENVQIYFRK